MNNNYYLVKKYIIFCLIILFTLSYITSILQNIINYDYLVIFTFFTIGILSIINIVLSLNYEFSLFKIHGYFFLIFLFLAPLHQYITQSFPWGWQINENTILFGNIIIIIWLIVYIITYRLTSSANSKGLFLPISKNIVYIGFFLMIISSVITFINEGSLENLISRSNNGNAFSSQSLVLILSTSVRPFPVLYFSYIYLISREKNNEIINRKVMRFFLIFTFLILLITNFPTAVSRYHAAAVYIGIILLLFRKWINFDILFLFGIVIIFPTLEIFRSLNIPNVISNFKFQIIDFSSGHFDAYSMLMRTIEFVIIHGSSYGYQLLGSILFFIPRSIWPSKPIGSGAYVGEEMGLNFLNISSPFIAEMIINFGFLFFLIGPIMLGIFNKKIDSRFWNFNFSLRYVNISFLFLIGFFFFILRGDLLSSFAYTIGFYIPLILLYFVTKFKI